MDRGEPAVEEQEACGLVEVAAPATPAPRRISREERAELAGWKRTERELGSLLRPGTSLARVAAVLYESGVVRAERPRPGVPGVLALNPEWWSGTGEIEPGESMSPDNWRPVVERALSAARGQVAAWERSLAGT